MRTAWLILLASTGCTFVSPPEGGDTGGDPGAVDDDGTVVEPGHEEPAASAACDRTDPALRLCVDFDGPVADRSASGGAIAAVGVTAMQRDGEPAAMLSAASTMHVRESTALDIKDGLALDMWIRPSSYPALGSRYWMLDNNQQYGASFTELGVVRCVLGSASLDGNTVVPIDGKFHHVACTYDRARLKVYVDGDVVRCGGLTAQIPTTGTSGLAIGANVSGSDADPDYYDAFVGGIDDVRVWARADLDVCAAAGRTGCQTACPLL